MPALTDDLVLFRDELTDDETLSAALELIDELDFELPGDSSQPSTPPTSVLPRDAQSVGKAKVSPRPKQRRSQREQLIALRSNVKELERELQVLRETKHSPDKELWKTIVMTQLFERQRAESENMRLQLMLYEHVTATRELEQALFKKRPIPEPDELTESADTTKRARPRKGIPHLGDENVEKELLDIVEAMYADVDTLIQTQKRKNTTERCRFSEIRGGDPTSDPVLEGADARMYPFDYRATADIMWQVFAEFIDSNVTILQERVDDDEGIVTRLYEQDVDLATWQGQFRIKVVGRRFVEDNRIIHIACMLMDPIELDTKPVDGLCIRQRIIDVIEAAPVNYLTTPATLKRSFGVFEPRVYDSHLSNDERREGVGMLTKFALMSGKRTCKEKHQYLENRLADSLGMITLNGDEVSAAERSDVLKRWYYHDDSAV
ncbi:hypothetical protein Poli38472_011861 [Pythium oligandrum]|uniref:Uncharacterized protein n=1 Tax=Pythium oligandrum TaxID=41045 RepID=A0A8K1FH02_PYTOL|nr:hypothetical protein Poli38472_011861 [Pythium oligandrum]|eukprot:TMW58273.1 hypothetical protein Poli38472_011861 [Pythium oligandrum]